jgi:type II secretory pathway pseudopilin PulG
VAVVILGLAGVAIVAGLMMSVQSSDLHRKEATGGAYVRSFAEAVQSYVDSSGFKPCASAASTYASVAVPALPAGYTKSVTAVSSWNGSTWGACAGDGNGVQRLDLKVTSPGDPAHRAAETLTVILRKPCNGDATIAGADPCS